MYSPAQLLKQNLFSFFLRLAAGIVLEYPMNGFLSLIISYLVVFGGYLHGAYVPADIVSNYGRIAMTSMIVASVLSVYLFVRAQYAEHRHTTGSPIYDFYHGIERHPRIGFFDLKVCLWGCFFCCLTVL